MLISLLMKKTCFFFFLYLIVLKFILLRFINLSLLMNRKFSRAKRSFFYFNEFYPCQLMQIIYSLKVIRIEKKTEVVF
jgi:hypothetical protein